MDVRPDEGDALKNLELIADWKRAWRLYSVHALLVAALLGVLEAALATAHIRWLPDWVHGVLIAVVSMSGVVGRVVKQDAGDAARIAELTK